MWNSRALLSLLFALSLSAKPARQDAAKLRAAVAHPDVAAAVKAQNALELPIVAVKVIDQRWFLGRESGLVRQTTTGKCAEQLRAFVDANPAYAEAVVLDRQGAVVCASTRTPVYWYGEEAFWQRAIKGETFRDATRIAIPMMDEEQTVGVITARAQ